MIHLKPIPIKTFDMNNRWDIDRDGVPDHRDCNPFDSRYQHVSQMTKERIKKEPIYITGSKASLKDVQKGITIYHLSEKKIPKSLQKTKQRALSVIHHYPEFLGSVERVHPKAVIFTTKGAYKETTGETYPADKSGESVVIIRAQKSSIEKGRRFGKQSVIEGMLTGVHELEHARQEEKWKEKPKLYKRMTSGRYEKKRSEVLAEHAEQRAIRRRMYFPSVGKYYETFQEVTK